MSQHAAARAGAGEQQAHRRIGRDGAVQGMAHGAAEPAQRGRRERREAEHRIEAGFQLAHHRPAHLHGGVAPAMRHAIAGVFRRDVETAEHGVLAIAGEELAMVAETNGAASAAG